MRRMYGLFNMATWTRGHANKYSHSMEHLGISFSTLVGWPSILCFNSINMWPHCGVMYIYTLWIFKILKQVSWNGWLPSRTLGGRQLALLLAGARDTWEITGETDAVLVSRILAIRLWRTQYQNTVQTLFNSPGSAAGLINTILQQLSK